MAYVIIPFFLHLWAMKNLRRHIFNISYLLILVLLSQSVFAQLPKPGKGKPLKGGLNTGKIPGKMGKDSTAVADSAAAYVGELYNGKYKMLTADRNVLQKVSGLAIGDKIVSWKFNPSTLDFDPVSGIDTALYFNHLFYPNQRNFESVTFLGNLGSPMQTDYFFNRNFDYSFLFDRYYKGYMHNASEMRQYHLLTPFTNVAYSMAGKRNSAEQTVTALHTQNVNKFLNVGLKYNFAGTKGIYQHQETRNNSFSLFASYFRNRVTFQGAFSYNSIRNQENGGLVLDSTITGEELIEARLVPYHLSTASVELRQRSFSGLVGYDIANFWARQITAKGDTVMVRKPLLTVKALFNTERNTRTFLDTKPYNSDLTEQYYDNYYISTSRTHDSVRLFTYEAMLVGELNQVVRKPGVPGLRVWIGYQGGDMYNFNRNDFLYTNENETLSTTHFGVSTYSRSDYLSYSGAVRLYLSGYRSGDKEIYGELRFSPWKSPDMPYIKGKARFMHKEPNVFIDSYFSNHARWETNFSKEQFTQLGGSIGADRWHFEAGINLMQLNNYIYFNQSALPEQSSSFAVTSAYAQKDFVLGGLHFFNKVIWQSSSSDVVSLPSFIAFSSIFYEHQLVPNALRGQIGVNVSYRTKFYADAYSPAIGQFYQQRERELGNYPFADAFVNLRWKRTLLYFKYEHVNQGLFDNEYFTALHYPANYRIFKFGLSWMFYD